MSFHACGNVFHPLYRVRTKQLCLFFFRLCQVVMSFHACGGNVGDNAQIPLPQWVLQVRLLAIVPT